MFIGNKLAQEDQIVAVAGTSQRTWNGDQGAAETSFVGGILSQVEMRSGLPRVPSG